MDNLIYKEKKEIDDSGVTDAQKSEILSYLK